MGTLEKALEIGQEGHLSGNGFQIALLSTPSRVQPVSRTSSTLAELGVLLWHVRRVDLETLESMFSLSKRHQS